MKKYNNLTKLKYQVVYCPSTVELFSSSQYSAALLVCGITIVPPTIFATANNSYISSVVTFSSCDLPRWYFMQSSQRSTILATRPSNSFVFTSNAPAAYVLVSKFHNLFITKFSLLSITSFILVR